MDFKQLEAFAHVVGFGSFSKAADKLHVTQPTISAHINSLEGELSAQLLVRTSREVYATDVGKLLYEYALEMLALRDNAIAACQKHQDMAGGSVSIVASSIPSQYVVPDVLAAFRQLHPHIQFNLMSTDSAGVDVAILAGRAEIGFTGARSDTPKLVYKPFMEDDLVVITPTGPPYDNMDTSNFRLEQLKQAPFILRESGSGTRRAIEATLEKRGFSPSKLHIIAQMDSLDAIKRAVSQGIGVSIVSRLSTVDFEKFGLIKVFRLDAQTIRRTLYLVHHKHRVLSPIAAALFKVASSMYTLKEQ